MPGTAARKAASVHHAASFVSEPAQNEAEVQPTITAVTATRATMACSGWSCCEQHTGLQGMGIVQAGSMRAGICSVGLRFCQDPSHPLNFFLLCLELPKLLLLLLLGLHTRSNILLSLRDSMSTSMQWVLLLDIGISTCVLCLGGDSSISFSTPYLQLMQQSQAP